MGAVIYPIYGNWLWGGGFLAKLGDSWLITQKLYDMKPTDRNHH